MWKELEDRVAHADPDRRMAALFAPRDTRRKLLALYAFNDELARIRDRVSEPMLGDLRLAWWREAVDELYDPAASVRAHATAVALQAAFADGAPPRVWIDRMINVRARDLDAEPFETLADLKEYAERSAGALTRAAVWLCAPGEDISSAGEAAARHVGVAWALTGLARGFAAELGRNRNWMPRQAWREAEIAPDRLTRERDPAAARRVLRPVIESARRAHGEAQARFREVPADAAPALLHAALIPAYLDRMAAEGYDPFAPKGGPPRLFRQARLVWASAAARI